MSLIIMPSSIISTTALSTGITALPTIMALWSDVFLAAKVGATTYSATATDGNSLGKELSDERWIEARTKLLISPEESVVFVPAFRDLFWLEPGYLGQWEPGGTFTVGGKAATPPGGNIRWIEVGDGTIKPINDDSGLWTIDGAQVELHPRHPVPVTHPHSCQDMTVITAAAVYGKTEWTPIGGGRAGDVLSADPGDVAARTFEVELRLNIPVGAATGGDVLANIEIYQES